MTDDLRHRLAGMGTAELVGVLRARDAQEWRSEVFPLVEAILRERGVDLSKIAGQGSEPAVESPGFDPIAIRDAAALLVAQSLLEGEGIRYYVRNASKHTTSPYPVTAVAVMVERARTAEARTLLKLLSPL